MSAIRRRLARIRPFSDLHPIVRYETTVYGPDGRIIRHLPEITR